MTQCEQILHHLRNHGSITQREAAKEYGIYRLAARIYDLRRENYDIHKEMEKTEDGTQFARYYLKQTQLSV